jgi:signal transduction histidine kinase
VLLSRLRIRGKLTLLVMIPLLAMVGLVLPVVRQLVTAAGKATDIDAAVTVAGRIGSLLQDVQRERLLSVGFLRGVVGENDLVVQTATVTDRIRDVRLDLGDALPAAVTAGIDQAQKLDPLRQRVRARSATPRQVLDGFEPVVDNMIDSLRLSRHADGGTAAGRQLNALDALLRMDESRTESTALLAAMAAGDLEHQYIHYREEATEYDTDLDRFTDNATPPQLKLYDLVAAGFSSRVGDDFDAKLDADPVRTMAALPIATLFPALESFSVLGGFVEKRLVDDVTALVAHQRRQQLAVAYGIGSLALVVLLGVLILVAVVARAVAVPLTRLSRSAERVADAGEAELLRVADDESETVDPVRLEVLDVSTNDEIGDLARVFERVQRTASQLVERQVLSRRNVAEMFGHIGRRTQNLVGGQVSLIDELETEETEPERLAKLYRLDHISNRLLRSADSLVVISGAERGESHSSPVRLVDVARLAVAEIEEYTRVDVDIPLDLAIAPAVVSDLVLICAELLENATSFSPPHTRVTVSARAVPDGARLVVVDHGIGMPDERLAEENTRIGRRERLDLVPTQVLGLFVVGRLARRHGLAVGLDHTSGGGVTVGVHIGAALLAGGRVVAAEPEPRPIAVDWPPAPWNTGEPAVTVLTAHRPAPEVRHPARPDVLSLVTNAMRDPLTWNGFEKANRLLPAPPVPDVPPTRQVPPSPVSNLHRRTTGPQAGSDHELRSLSRRVPGANLPSLEAAPAWGIGLPTADHDPDQARLLVEQFESGVAQALHLQNASPNNTTVKRDQHDG